MPSASWIAAAKKTPMEPVYYAACESVEAINITQNLASDWNAGAIDNLDVFDIPGGGSGLRPKLYTYSNAQVTWWTAAGPAVQPVTVGGFTFAAPVIGFLEYVRATWTTPIFGFASWSYVTPTFMGWAFYNEGHSWYTSAPQVIGLLSKGLYQGGAAAPFAAQSYIDYTSNYFHFYGSRGTIPYKDLLPFYPSNTSDFQAGFRAKTGTITTKVFDLGTAPNVTSRVLIEDMVTGTSSITYTAEGSANGTSGWVSLGAISDGRELAPHRYYRITAIFTSTGYDTPELYSIRIVGGNQQLVYLGTHRGEPALTSGEVQPYLQKVSSVSSKIALKDKPTVGDLSMDLTWLPLTSDLVQSTGKRRSVTVYKGFVGLPKADYEPYFTGMWESYSADQNKRIFSVKLRDVWKRFKKKVPEQQSQGGALIPIKHQFGQSPSGIGTPLNIIDAMVQIADLAKAPDRFIDRDAFAALKAAHFSGAEWNVYRVLTDQKDSDDLLKELAITAGLFLIPAPNGKLTPYHYETIVAATPAVTLDAAQIKFTNLVPDMAETVTRHNIYFNLIEDSQGRRSGGDPADYSNVYTTLGSTNSVIAERDREEVIIGEWFDNWGLASGATNGVPNPLTKLADRLESWYTPVANVGGKDVSTTKVNVKAENVPLRYYSDVMPGKTVMVDNLRLPCPIASWEGFSSQVKFLVMSWAVDSKNETITLDLFQISPLTYNAAPTWNTYNQRDLVPQVTSLGLAEKFTIGSDGIARPSILLTFQAPTGYVEGVYEIWISEGGGPPYLYTTLPASQSVGMISITIPGITGVDYSVIVVTVTSTGTRTPLQDAPAASITPSMVAVITAATLKLLNDNVNMDTVDDYLNGIGSFSDVLDTYTPAAQPGVGQPGVFATKGQMLIQADRQIQLKAGSADVSAQVDILSAAIGLKLNATGTVGAGMLISWTDESHTKSQIQFWSDTFQICKPDGTGVKPVFTVGNIAGASTVGISGDMVLDGALLARHIATNQLVVGTNVGIGTAVTSAGVTTIVGNTVTTSFVNALDVTAVDISATTLTGKTVQTASSNERFVVSAADNKAHFFGDIGNGTIAELATIGTTTDATYGTAIATFGTYNSTLTGVRALNDGSNPAGEFICISSGSPAVRARSTYGYGGNFSQGDIVNGDVGKAPIRLGPAASTAAPTHSALPGSLWVTGSKVLYINTSTGPGEGTTWQKVGAQ